MRVKSLGQRAQAQICRGKAGVISTVANCFGVTEPSATMFPSKTRLISSHRHEPTQAIIPTRQDENSTPPLSMRSDYYQSVTDTFPTPSNKGR